MKILILLSRAGRIAVAVALCLAAPMAQAQAYPSKPVKFVIPYPPGGLADSFARARPTSRRPPRPAGGA